MKDVVYLGPSYKVENAKYGVIFGVDSDFKIEGSGFDLYVNHENPIYGLIGSDGNLIGKAVSQNRFVYYYYNIPNIKWRQISKSKCICIPTELAINEFHAELVEKTYFDMEDCWINAETGLVTGSEYLKVVKWLT